MEKRDKPVVMSTESMPNYEYTLAAGCAEQGNPYDMAIVFRFDEDTDQYGTAQRTLAFPFTFDKAQEMANNIQQAVVEYKALAGKQVEH